MNGEQVLLGLAAIGGLSGLAALADVYFRRNKSKAEEVKLLAEAERLDIDGDINLAGTALEMYKLARAEAQDARRRAMYCEAKVDALEEHTRELRRVMRRHAIEPPQFQFPTYSTWMETRT